MKVAKLVLTKLLENNRKPLNEGGPNIPPARRPGAGGDTRGSSNTPTISRPAPTQQPKPPKNNK